MRRPRKLAGMIEVRLLLRVIARLTGYRITVSTTSGEHITTVYPHDDEALQARQEGRDGPATL